MIVQLITLISCFLGLVAPLIFWWALNKGIRSARFEKEKQAYLIQWSSAGTLIWVTLVFLLTTFGVFEFKAGDWAPRFIIALLIPVAVIFGLMLKPTFQVVLDHIPTSFLVGGQFFRIFGAVFFLVAISGIGPAEFVSSGYGDVLTGLLAIFGGYMLDRRLKGAITMTWVFTIIGMLDLVNVSVILLSNYPIWSEAAPSTASAGAFPLMLIVGLTAPAALMLHVFSIRALLRHKAKR